MSELTELEREVLAEIAGGVDEGETTTIPGDRWCRWAPALCELHRKGLLVRVLVRCWDITAYGMAAVQVPWRRSGLTQAQHDVLSVCQRLHYDDVRVSRYNIAGGAGLQEGASWARRAMIVLRTLEKREYLLGYTLEAWVPSEAGYEALGLPVRALPEWAGGEWR